MTGSHLFRLKPWMPDEDEQLRAMLIAGRTPAEIAINLRRTAEAVKARARRLRLSFKQVEARR
jgi:hypothetical protein